VIHFNPVTGVYSYDPRTEQPNSFFLQNRPDDVLVQTLMRQIEKDGSYPAGATSKLTKVEPVHVDLSIYSDWAAEAKVTTRLYYDDGSVTTEVFRFFDVGSMGMFMPFVPGQELSTHAYFDRLARCASEGPGVSYCGVD
jgi:hypothetical protein